MLGYTVPRLIEHTPYQERAERLNLKTYFNNTHELAPSAAHQMGELSTALP
jgi:hypothetical protein